LFLIGFNCLFIIIYFLRNATCCSEIFDFSDFLPNYSILWFFISGIGFWLIVEYLGNWLEIVFPASGEKNQELASSGNHQKA
jgi:hypothetical protein